MSLSRLALRLAAFEALRPSANLPSGPWPTLAGSNIYDSRLDPVDGAAEFAALIDELEGKPLVTLYTEDTEGEPTEGNITPVDRSVVTLVAELMLATRGEVEVEAGDGSTQFVGTIMAPITDRQHEALLDVLEAQVVHAIDPAYDTPGQALLRKAVMELHHVHSVPLRSSDRVTRLAARTVKFRLRVFSENWPRVPVASGLDALPEPLRSVALAMPAGSTGAAECARVAALLQPPAALLPLAGIDMAVTLDRHPASSGAPDVSARAATPT